MPNTDYNQMFFTSAIAESNVGVPPVAPEANWIANLLPIALIFVIFYFLLIRPQSAAIKKHNQMLGGIKKGDKVLTSGGIIAKVVSVKDDTATVEIATGVNVEVKKASIKDLA